MKDKANNDIPTPAVEEELDRYEYGYYGDMIWTPIGDWVQYKDYAALKAKHEKLDAALKLAMHHAPNHAHLLADLLAENKRLIKAGDAMACVLFCQLNPENAATIKNWNDAKNSEKSQEQMDFEEMEKHRLG